MRRLQPVLIAVTALLMVFGPVTPVAAEHTIGCEWCGHGDGDDGDDGGQSTPPPSTPQPTPQPTPEPQPEPQPEPEPQPQPQPQPDPTPAPQRDTSPNTTTTTRSTPRPTASPAGTPEPTPLESIDPEATPEILVQGPILDDSSEDDERLDVAQGAAENQGSGGWAFFLVGFLLGGAIGWVGRGVRSMRRRRKQQLFG